MCTSFRDPCVRRQRGITLIELIMFIVIISSALAGILLVMDQVTRNSADPLVRKQALAIAESLLEEIQLQPLNLALCTGPLVMNGARSGAGCVTDYAGYTTTGGIREYSNLTPAPVVAGLEGYNVVGVAVIPLAVFGGTAIPAGSGVQITVTVSDPLTALDGVTVAAIGYRAGQ